MSLGGFEWFLGLFAEQATHGVIGGKMRPKRWTHNTKPCPFARSHNLNMQEGRRQYGGGKILCRRFDGRVVELHAGLRNARTEGYRVGEGKIIRGLEPIAFKSQTRRYPIQMPPSSP